MWRILQVMQLWILWIHRLHIFHHWKSCYGRYCFCLSHCYDPHCQPSQKKDERLVDEKLHETKLKCSFYGQDQPTPKTPASSRSTHSASLDPKAAYFTCCQQLSTALAGWRRKERWYKPNLCRGSMINPLSYLYPLWNIKNIVPRIKELKHLDISRPSFCSEILLKIVRTLAKIRLYLTLLDNLIDCFKQ